MKKKRLTAALIAAAVMTTLCACSSATADTGETAGVAQTGDSATVTTQDNGGETDIWAPYDETVTLHTVTSETASAGYPDGDDVTNNVWTREYKNRFNVEVATDWVSDEYDTKLNLSIAEGDIPDVFHVNESQLQQLVDADLILDLTDLYETYASDTIKGYINGDPDCLEAGKYSGSVK